MAAPPSPPSVPTEEDVVELYRQAGYDIRQAVGDAPGAVVWLVTPTHGPRRPTSLVRVFPAAPDVPDRLRNELEAARRALGVNVATGIVLQGSVVPRYGLHLTDLVSFRRWFLALAGITEYVRELVARYEGSELFALHLPRRARLGEVELDAGPAIEDWIARGDEPRLTVAGVVASGKTSVLLHAAHAAGLRFERDPEGALPLIFHGYEFHPIDGLELPDVPPPGLLQAAAERGFVIPVMPEEDSLHAPRCVIEVDEVRGEPSREANGSVLWLLEPAPGQVDRGLEEHLASPRLEAALSDARRASEDFAVLTDDLRSTLALARAIRRHARPKPFLGIQRWIVEVVGDYVDEVLGEPYFYADPKSVVAEAAYRYHRWGERDGLISAAAMLTDASRLWGIGGGELRYTIVREYLLGFHVARQATSGELSVLLEGPFPRFALHTIAVLAPEIAADLMFDDVARLEQQIEREVEKRLQLTFAHMLNRPVGMLRHHLREIREGIDEKEAKLLASPFRGAEDELAHLADIAEKTRLWQESPEGPFGDFPLLPAVEGVIRPLVERYPQVTCQVDVDPVIVAHVIDHVLREVVHCIVENAFHAALAGGNTPSVRVAGRFVGHAVTIEVEDSGDGVALEEQETIFEPLRTTKKGGIGKPRGTGLGLPIARKYARVLGGRVALLADRERTTFTIELVGRRSE